MKLKDPQKKEKEDEEEKLKDDNFLWHQRIEDNV